MSTSTIVEILICRTLAMIVNSIQRFPRRILDKLNFVLLGDFI
jgi:hypothetical protein